MKHIKLFESFPEETSNTHIPKKERRESTQRPDRKDIKRCIGQCERKFFLKDGNPVIYCPSCDRILNN